MSLRTVTLLDTSVATKNLGDEIIVDAIRRHVESIFHDSLILRVGTHDPMGPRSRELVRKGQVAIAAGTNLLTARMWYNAPWKLRPIDALSVNNVVLMGCGWYQYQDWWDPYSNWLLKSVLSKRHIHATRDAYSREKLKKMGIENVVNTSCPTLWDITPEHCATLPVHKAREVVTTVNTSFKDRDLDRRMIEMLQANYERVHFWMQRDTDWDYAASLAEGLSFVDPSLAAFDQLLEQHDSLDYVGNRLHGGIRALQKGRRSVIIEVDNRAAEMGRDFALPTLARDDFDQLDALISGPHPIKVTPPMDVVDTWRAQFKQS